LSPATLGRPTCRTTAPGGRTLFGRWFPGALRMLIVMPAVAFVVLMAWFFQPRRR
jgi:hypothetical protein